MEDGFKRPDGRQEARGVAVAVSGERWLCLSWAVPWEWKAGDICERCMGGDSPIGWGW